MATVQERGVLAPTPGVAAAGLARARGGRGGRSRAWRRFRRYRPGLVGLASVVALVLTAVFAPLIAPQSPTDA